MDIQSSEDLYHELARARAELHQLREQFALLRNLTALTVNGAYERAAEICEGRADYGAYSDRYYARDALIECAAAIRALKHEA
jgi:hypothetical protein